MKQIFLAIFALIFLSGCSLGTTATGAGGVFKSTDGGRTFEQKVAMSDEGTISGVSVLSMVVDPADNSTIYIGTMEHGIFVTHDGGQMWEPITFPPQKVYGFAIDPTNTEVLYATGVWQEQGKVYKSEDGGVSWKEIYVEPGDGTVPTALALHPRNAQTLYVATSAGIVVRSVDGGASWQHVYEADGPVTTLTFDTVDPSIFYLAIFQKGIVRFRADGTQAENLTKNISSVKDGTSAIYAIAADPQQSGVLYVGTDHGIFKSTSFGDQWEQVPIIGSSREFPIRALAVNPLNPEEITYNAGRAVYTSVRGNATQWSIAESSAGKLVDEILYDPLDATMIYLGLRDS
ncbi:MAG TPA: lipoprotein [Patescibacteria group bacterium]|nr:lipoprotein [Patescibacteria group bacterium]